MHEFFQGWRRKTGLALLAMAVLLTVAWFRSLVITDAFSTVVLGDLHVVQSGHGVAVWARPLGSTIDFGGLYAHVKVENRHLSLHNLKIEHWRSDKNWRCCWQYGIGNAAVGSHEQVGSGLRTLWWRAPYWVLVLPLTLLSAFLIVSKPRQPKSANEPKRA